MLRYVPKILESTRLSYLALLLSTLPIWINLPHDRVIAGGDLGVPFYRAKSQFLNVVYVWSSYNGGSGTYVGLPRLPTALFQALFDTIGFSSALSQGLYFCLEYFIAGASMYYLITSVFREDSKKRLAGLVSGIVYMYNPYTLVYGAALWYGVIPFILAAYINGLERKSNTKYSIYIVIAFFATITTYPTYSHIISTMIPPVLYTVFHSIWHKFNLRKLWFGFKTFVLLVVSNIWWLIPALLTYRKEIISALPLMQFTHEYSTILEVMRRLGAWQMHESWKGMPYFLWSSEYLLDPTIIVLSMIPICLFSYTLIIRSKDRRILFFSVMTIVAIFLAKGRNPPYGQFYDWLLRRLPFFVAYRESMRFATLISLGLSAILGIVAADLTKIESRAVPRRSLAKLSKPVRFLIPIGLTALVLSTAWPIFTGDVFINPYDPTHKGIVIPPYYDEANGWFDEHLSLSRLFLAPNYGLYVAYKWGYQGVSPASQLFLTPVIENTGGGYSTTSAQESISLTYSLLVNISSQRISSSEDKETLSKMIGFLNAKFIVLNTELDTDFYRFPPVSATAAILDSSPWNGPTVKFGPLWIYSNPFFAPRAYVTSNVLMTEDNSQGLINALRQKDMIPGETAVFASSKLSPTQVGRVEAAIRNHIEKPIMSFERITPTKYVIHVGDAKYPFVLVLSESYHDLWRAEVNGQELSDHLLVNGYANAWLVHRTGSFEIVIEYLPQRILLYSSFASVLGVALWLSVLLIYERPKRASSR